MLLYFHLLLKKRLMNHLIGMKAKSIGLGDRFIDVVDKTFTVISENPVAFPKKKRNYRDMVIDTFPYIIVYEHNNIESSIYILHVFHTSRNSKHKYRRK